MTSRLVTGDVLPGDMLLMAKINALPHPLMVRFVGDKRRTGVHDIDVETGSMRADVCGQLDVRSFCEVMELIDDSGATHDPETFYTDYEA